MTMTLQDALDKVFATDRGVTRPSLMDRNSFICYHNTNHTLKLRRFDSPLVTDWCPTFEDLMACDWQTVSIRDQL